ncbi:MAG: ribonuclease HII [Nanoarchaeota archaeon]|nr:ribonuclease HII [Nanoarchaeota archaeon]
MLKLGIDDAGRGPVIGPMILSGVLIDDKTEREFRRLGVKDSKQLTEKRREFLADIIREKAVTFEVEIISPKEIDYNKSKGVKLNEVEAFACARIINKINKGYKEIKVILDCPSTSIVKWQDFLKTKIKNLSNLEISCEHKADKNHISVSAASILAKSIREKEMFKLKEIYGKEMGSGYPSDPKTKKFLKKNVKKYNDKGIFRKS